MDRREDHTMKIPDGWIFSDLIIWNEFDRRGFASQGGTIEMPDLRQATDPTRVALHEALRVFLKSLEESTRAQFRWSVDSDYFRELRHYQEDTEQRPQTRWSYRTRQERYNRYLQGMEAGLLRRERLVLFLSRRIPADPPPGASKTQLTLHFEQLAQQMSLGFQQTFQILQGLLDQFGARIHLMDSEQLARYLRLFFNPTDIKRPDFEPHASPDLSIQENFWHGGCQGGKTFGFYLDGFLHNLIVLKRRPQRTFPGIIYTLTNLPFLDYALTINVEPLNASKEIDKEERALQRVRGDYASEGKYSLLTAARVKEARIQELAQGNVAPFRYEFYAHVWDEDAPSLVSKTRQIEAAIQQMAEAQSWTTNLSSPACTKNVWIQTWPGWLWGTYTCHSDTGLDSWLADLLPFSCSFTGMLEGAEAVYEGSNRNLVGIRNFVSNTPQPAVVLGMTRAGKSAFVCDLLSQTQPFYDFTLIVEEGLSYGTWTQAQGEIPIIISADGELTLNYFDTQGGPLTRTQITTAAALVLKMSGVPQEEDRRNLRLAQITQYIEQLYDDTAREWLQKRPHESARLARLALYLKKMQRDKMPMTSTFQDTWLEFHRQLTEEGDERFEDDFTEQDISQFLQEPDSAKVIRNLTYAFFEPQDYPTHDLLYEMMLVAPLAEHDKEEIKQLATLLAPWCEQRLLSGKSTISMQRTIAHFELGFIQESDRALKEVAGFLIANYGRQYVLNLPRRVRKRVIFEEVARLLDIPGGSQLVAEFYAQLSKFNTWIVSIVQQYSRFKESSIRPVVFGNAKQFFFMRMNDRRDVDDVASDIHLSESSREIICRHPLPEHLPEENKYSALTYYHLDAKQPLCGTIHNRVSPEMLYCASSSGDVFDDRSKRLASCPDPVSAIVESVSEIHPQ
ncbi:MAG: hypothetical protein C5B47_06735 [Verrucomicrobia bacterium]|nr:MAG: hypothetical protein C5B47_06735 [Verrucomicrobiota bacterium]